MEMENAKKPNDQVVDGAAERLIEFASDKIDTFIRDSKGEVFAKITVDNHQETRAIDSTEFKRWLGHEYWAITGKTSSSDAISRTVAILASKAYRDAPTFDVFTRVGLFGEAIWYDHADRNWSATVIDVDGWRNVKSPVVHFKRYSHQLPQVTPLKGGDLREVLGFINISDDSLRLLLVCYLVSCFVPDIAHPVFLLSGPQGSSKTTLLRLLRSLIDPSKTEVLSLPRDQKELVITLDHHWFAPFDNISHLPEWASDSFCRAVTGEGFAMRKLYTNSDEEIIAYRRCAALNGINTVAQKSDLLDRSIVMELEPIPAEQRKYEDQMWRQFADRKPYILGSIFDTLSKAMDLLPTIQIQKKPRLADFVRWGCAIATALGYEQRQFEGAYWKNVERQHEIAIAESPLTIVVIALMENMERWRGKPTELLDLLNDLAPSLKVDTQRKPWPQDTNWLTKRLKEIMPNLEAAEIEFLTNREANHRIIELRKTGHGQSTMALTDGTNGNDSTFPEFGDANDAVATADLFNDS